MLFTLHLILFLFLNKPKESEQLLPDFLSYIALQVSGAENFARKLMARRHQKSAKLIPLQANLDSSGHSQAVDNFGRSSGRKGAVRYID